MKRFFTLALLVATSLFLACEPEYPFGGDEPGNGNQTQEPIPVPKPDEPEEPTPENPTPEPENPTPDPEPAEITATLTYSECKSSIGGYSKPANYRNSYGIWVVCAYDFGSAIQLNSYKKTSYIGTPTFEGEIKKISLELVESYSDNIELCAESTSGTFESFSCGGKAQEYTLSTKGIKRLFIRSTACARITKITIVAGGNGSGNGGGTTPEPENPTPENPEPENPEPENPTPDPTPDPTPGDGTASQDWLELPAADNGVRYPNGVEVTITSGGERNYTILYDKSTYTSMWVAYPLESKHMGGLKRPGSWSFNPLIDTEYQVDLRGSSYVSGYSRGHLIPNGSRNGIKEMQKQTFYVTNSVPQIQDNFNGGIWNNLENALQSIADSEKIYIVTGVLFSKVGESKTIKYTKAKDDTKDVPVPNYFYKVVLKVTTNGGAVTSASTIGFWFEHKTYSDSYTNYAVSVDQIEQWTGFDFFPNLPDSIENSVESNSSWSSFQSF